MPVPTTSAAMTAKDVWQLVVSALAPFIAAGVALWIATIQQRERVSCFITWGVDQEYNEYPVLGIHNRSSQPVAITAVRYRVGIIIRKLAQGTALDYEDPFDLAFPYVVAPGEIRRLALQEHQALKLAESVGRWRVLLARILRRSRVLVECTTTTGASYYTSAEKVLPWDLQLSWKRT